MKKVYLYKGFERLWHWTQAISIIMLLLTGFEVHGYWKIFGFADAVLIHNVFAYILITATVFSLFWFITTGAWRQFIPTSFKGIFDMIKFYTSGIFKGEPHPEEKNEKNKFNQLQRLTYLGLLILLLPYQLITGILYLYAKQLTTDSFIVSYKIIGVAHTFGAFLFVAFIIVHVYMTTTGHTLFSSIIAMITGSEEVE